MDNAATFGGAGFNPRPGRGHGTTRKQEAAIEVQPRPVRGTALLIESGSQFWAVPHARTGHGYPIPFLLDTQGVSTHAPRTGRGTTRCLYAAVVFQPTRPYGARHQSASA